MHSQPPFDLSTLRRSTHKGTDYQSDQQRKREKTYSRSVHRSRRVISSLFSLLKLALMRPAAPRRSIPLAVANAGFCFGQTRNRQLTATGNVIFSPLTKTRATHKTSVKNVSRSLLYHKKSQYNVKLFLKKKVYSYFTFKLQQQNNKKIPVYVCIKMRGAFDSANAASASPQPPNEKSRKRQSLYRLG